MAISNQMKDRLTLIDNDGSVLKDGIQAAVTPNKITTFETSIAIKPGQKFTRTLTNGAIETFVVDRADFQQGIGSIKPTYIVHVHKE
jgi:acyl CoA:acetate/3-ketoacid CoA transferase alpha subunit|tara:strand:+ start:654 stop:914 length:261 start_codon:yes stop_codon:yes gene_type:complete